MGDGVDFIVFSLCFVLLHLIEPMTALLLHQRFPASERSDRIATQSMHLRVREVKIVY
jgi:hypothetical protein